MERRLTAFVIPVLLALLGLSIFAGPGTGPNDPSADPAAPTARTHRFVDDANGDEGGSADPGARPAPVQDPDAAPQRPSEIEEITFVRTFGTEGADEPGFRVRFDRRAAGVWAVELLDHRVVRGEAEDPADPPLYPIVETVQPRWINLALEESGRTERAFPDVQLDGGKALWTAEDLDDRQGVRFTLDTGNGFRLERTYVWEPGRRDLLLEVALRAVAEHDTVGRSVPLRLRGVALPNPKRNYVLGQNPALAAGRVAVEGGTAVEEFVRPDPEDLGVRALVNTVGEAQRLEWVGTTNRFFCAMFYPATPEDAARVTGARYELWPQEPRPDVSVRTVPMALVDFTLAAPAVGAEPSRIALRLYLGPKSKRVFERSAAPDEYRAFGAVVDHDLKPIGCFCEIPGAQPIARFLLWILGLIQDVVGNWGIAIMLLTVCVRGSLIPLNFRMQKAMRAYGARAAKCAPEMEKIKQKYKDDPKQLQIHLLQFQRENKLFPPVGGCLPMFVTIPIFIGLFTALRASYDLRGQAFFGWIDDLSQPDMLASVVGYPFNLLPILWGSLTLYLQSQAPLPKDPQQRQVMQIMRFMPLMFAFLLYNYASGLMVYMITSGLFALLEMRLVRKILGPMPETPMGGTPMPL